MYRAWITFQIDKDVLNVRKRKRMVTPESIRQHGAALRARHFEAATMVEKLLAGGYDQNFFGEVLWAFIDGPRSVSEARKELRKLGIDPADVDITVRDLEKDNVKPEDQKCVS